MTFLTSKLIWVWDQSFFLWSFIYQNVTDRRTDTSEACHIEKPQSNPVCFMLGIMHTFTHFFTSHWFTGNKPAIKFDITVLYHTFYFYLHVILYRFDFTAGSWHWACLRAIVGLGTVVVNISVPILISLITVSQTTALQLSNDIYRA